MDAALRFRRLLEVPTFARFCERVCAQAADFTRCSIAIWDSTGTQRTKRWMYHQVCESFYGNPDVRAARCDRDDARTVGVVVRTGVKQSYVCWAGFTCEMVPILAWDQPIGLVSIGEFFTPDCNKLRDVAIQEANTNKLLPILGDTQSREIPVLREEQLEGVLTAVQHLARIIGDLVMARINPDTLPEYLNNVADQIARSWAETVSESGRLAAALEGFALVSLANLFFEDVHGFLQRHRDFSLHKALSPLSIINIQAESLPNECVQRHRIIEASRMINRDARALLAETDVLAGSWWKLTPEPLKPKSLAEMVLVEFQSRCENGDRLSLEGTSRTAWGDVSLARFVLSELVTNAFKATTPGQRRITGSLELVGIDLVIDVSDNGCGIPENQIDRIFESGVRLEQSGYGTGSGHGLFKLKENVTFVGGRVDVQSSTGSGSRVRVVLPGFPPKRSDDDE
ncbi:MAG: ATP-binding protein [bacterium]|nr:ATP-binding protein [bacterium]